MAKEVTATEAARRFSELLNQVRYRGESFDIVRNGEIVARITTAGGVGRATLSELFELLAATAPVGESFADDLEMIQADQPALPDDPWVT